VPPHKQAPEKPVKSFQQPPPPAAKSAPAKPPAGFEPRKEGIKRPPPQLIAPAPSKEPPPAVKKGAPPPKELPPGVKKAAPPTAKPPAQGPALKRLEERRERVEDGGPRKVLPKPGKRLIVKERDRSIIRHDHAERFLRLPGAKSERKSDGRVETYYVRPDGVRVVTVVDRHGRLLRRFRRHRDGREYSIIDNRRFYQALGIAAIGIIVLNLPPPHVTIPLESYIVDYESASDDDLYDTLAAPPIENLGRAYSLDEILDNEELRARMRRVDVDSITFEFGSSEVPPDQYDKLERIARAILRVLRDNPQAVFLLAGHTDAPGDPDNNLTLSDQRAQSVAAVLSEAFDVPPENLVTQGYGEQYLKIDTEEPEPRNRRVSVISIGALMAER
jgi:outer membrane protein OmpA-like peptidoglycan-associated protein